MNFQRVTVSLPKYIYEELSSLISKRQLSNFVTTVIEERILEHKSQTKDPISHFFSLREKTPKVSDTEILAAIKRGRK